MLPSVKEMAQLSGLAIDGATEVMTVTLKDAADTALWLREIEPQAA